MELPRPNTGLQWFMPFRDALVRALATVDETGVATATASGRIEATTTLADATAGAIVLTMPSATSGRLVVVKKQTAPNTVTLDGNGANIDGAATLVISTALTAYTLRAIAGNWWIV